jgi:hypothetical protein
MEKVKKRQPNNHQKLIQRFVTVDVSAPASKTFWGNQMKIAGQLITKYGLDFLLQMQPPSNYKVSTLVWFLTPEGKQYLSDQLFEYKKANTNLYEQRQEIPPPPAIIADNKEVTVEPAKPRTLKEFLNYGKKGS